MCRQSHDPGLFPSHESYRAPREVNQTAPPWREIGGGKTKVRFACCNRVYPAGTKVCKPCHPEKA